jgi:glycosyltransferase involved in cell wall biosynthesis
LHPHIRRLGVSTAGWPSPLPMRIAVLWQQMSGYFAASLRALAKQPGVDLCLAFRRAEPNAPFDSASFDWAKPQYSWDGEASVTRLDQLLAGFDPDAVLISSWHIGAYRAALRHLRRPTTKVLCMDNQWLGTPKQWLGRLTWRLYIRPLFDIAFVPGDRQLAFANRLGFRNSHVLRGLYCADTEAFTPHTGDAPNPNRAFLFVGRLIELKGVSVLIDAYQRYR